MLWFTNLGTTNCQSNEIQRTERLQRRATKYVLDIPFRCETTYNQRLSRLGLIPLSYIWHEFLDMVVLYKLIHGLMRIDEHFLPQPISVNKPKGNKIMPL
jgi:hypothetical protein